MRCRLIDRRVGRLHVTCRNHFDGGCTHGPATWPWWKVVSFGWVHTFNADLTGAVKSQNMRRLWIYFRWPRGDRDSVPPLRHWKGVYRNRALMFDFFLCRR